MTEVYRFRSTDQLLGKFKELERQTIYFASPEQLNDPVEGFRDIVWSGDEIVWSNLFKHYVYCLFLAYLQVGFIGDQCAFEAEDILVAGGWHDPPSPQAGELFGDIWNSIRDNLKLSEIASKIAALSRKVRRNELLFYLLPSPHFKALVTIQDVLVERGIVSEPKRPLREILSGKFTLADSRFFELVPEVERGEPKDFLKTMFSISYQMMTDLRLSYKRYFRSSSSGNSARNWQLLLLDFPSIYVEQLGRILWPQWYAACFSKSYHNSSLWASYGDGHRGVCLIFDAATNGSQPSLELKQRTGWATDSRGNSKEHWGFRPKAFHDINYSDRPGEVDFFRNIGRLPEHVLMELWYTDEAANVSECAAHVVSGGSQEDWRKTYWDAFYRDITFKTNDWEHEQECRLILNGLLEESLDDRRRSLTYDFDSLKGVIFGIRTTDENKMKVIEIIQEKCRETNRNDFEFYQAYYDPQQGDIRRFELRLNLIVKGEGSSS